MPEDKCNRKILSLKPKQKKCPFCKNTYTYFCTICRSSTLLQTNYLLRDYKFLTPQRHAYLQYIEIHYENADLSIYKDMWRNFTAYLKHLHTEPSSSDRQEIEIQVRTEEITFHQRPGSVPINYAAASSSSLKSKKSSNILSTIVKRARMRKKIKSADDMSIKSILMSPQNLNERESNSTVGAGAHTEDENEMEINIENYEKKYESSENLERIDEKIQSDDNLNTTLSNHSISSSCKPKKQNFFKRLLKRQYSSNQLKKPPSMTTEQENMSDPIEKNLGTKFSEYNSCEPSFSKVHYTHPENIQVNSNELLTTSKDIGTAIVVSSYLNFDKPLLNVSLASGLQLIQEIMSSLKDSENHLLQVLAKYITDPRFHRELVDTLCQHSKIQWEAERRTSALANEMWMQQLEIGRTQEKSLQNTLNSLVKQNRELQIDNEVLFKKYEKLLKRMRNLPEMAAKSVMGESEMQCDGIFRQNEKLLHKLDAYMQKTESMENEMQSLQKQNDTLEQQLRNSSAKIHSLKTSIQRFKTDYDLEVVTLNYKLQQKEQNIRDALEAADVVLDDLDGLKRQFKTMPFTLNWSKFKCRGSCLTDLIHMCRSCINELFRELVTVNTQLALKEQDSNTLRETNSKLQENLKKSTEELDNLSKQMQQGTLTSLEQVLSEQKIKLMENEIKVVEDKLEKCRMDFENEKSGYLKELTDYGRCKIELAEKEQIIQETKLFMNNITTENFSLKAQIEGLNKVLKECGAGDITKELEINQEQVAYFRSHFSELTNENQHLLLKLESISKENKALRNNQETNYNHLKSQLEEIEKLQQENNALRRKLEREHQTVLTLQNERVKHLDEKSVLKNIFQHMKTELQRVQQLETSLTDVTKQASKLGMIAEYNKQQGEKLKSEVLERDYVIQQLKSNVDKLNDLQIKNAKEKLSLCYELSEVCQVKDQLNSVLSHEKEKIVKLGQSKQELVKMADSQIQKIEEKQRNERTALRLLAKDFKSQVDRNDTLKKEKDKLVIDIESLKANIQDMTKKFEESADEGNRKENYLNELKKELQDVKFNNLQLNEKIKNDLKKYEMNLKPLEKLIQELRKEKNEMEKSIEYLQTNSKKLHTDLNVARENEKTAQDMFKQSIAERDILEHRLNERFQDMESLRQEKDELVKEIQQMNSICEKILNDFEVNIKSSEDKEELFKCELKEAKSVLFGYSQGIEELNKMVKLKDEKISELNEKNHNFEALEQKYEKLAKEFKEKEIEFDNLLEIKNDIQRQRDDIQDEYDSSNSRVQSLDKEMNVLQTQMNIILSQKEADYRFYKKRMDELAQKTQETEETLVTENSNLKFQVRDLTQKLQNEKAAYETLSHLHKDVSSKFMKSIKDLVDAKNLKQEAVDKLKVHGGSVEKVIKEKNLLLAELEAMKAKKESVEQAYLNLQQTYNSLLVNNFSTANALKQAECKAADSEVCNEHVAKLQETIQQLSLSLEDNFNTIQQMKDDISHLQQQTTQHELQKSDITLRLHETERRLETEKNISEQLRNTRKLILASILKLKEEGKVESADCAHLLHMVGSNASISCEEMSSEKQLTEYKLHCF